MVMAGDSDAEVRHEATSAGAIFAAARLTGEILVDPPLGRRLHCDPLADESSIFACSYPRQFDFRNVLCLRMVFLRLM